MAFVQGRRWHVSVSKEAKAERKAQRKALREAKRAGRAARGEHGPEIDWSAATTAAKPTRDECKARVYVP